MKHHETLEHSSFEVTISALDVETSSFGAATSAIVRSFDAMISALDAETSALDVEKSSIGAVTSAIARSYWHRVSSDCGVGITSQMCNRVTNHGD